MLLGDVTHFAQEIQPGLVGHLGPALWDRYDDVEGAVRPLWSEPQHQLFQQIRCYCAARKEVEQLRLFTHPQRQGSSFPFVASNSK